MWHGCNQWRRKSIETLAVVEEELHLLASNNSIHFWYFLGERKHGLIIFRGVMQVLTDSLVGLEVEV